MSTRSLVLDKKYHQEFTTALRNVLSTDIAEFTLSQILDGLPVAEVAQENLGTCTWEGHPVFEHKELCDGVLDRFIDIREHLNVGVVNFEAGVSRPSSFVSTLSVS